MESESGIFQGFWVVWAPGWVAARRTRRHLSGWAPVNPTLQMEDWSCRTSVHVYPRYKRGMLWCPWPSSLRPRLTILHHCRHSPVQVLKQGAVGVCILTSSQSLPSVELGFWSMRNPVKNTSCLPFRFSSTGWMFELLNSCLRLRSETQFEDIPSARPKYLVARRQRERNMPAACFQFGPAHSFFFFCGGRYRT